MTQPREEYDTIGEIKHAEWWDGVCVVTPGAPRHQLTSKRLLFRVEPHVPQGHTLLHEVGVRTPDADLIPDLVIVSRTARVDETEHWFLDPPLLTLEILSPSTQLFDLTLKRDRYAAHGVSWYWILDPRRNEFLVLRNAHGTFTEVQRINPRGTTLGPISVEIDVPSLCAPLEG